MAHEKWNINCDIVDDYYICEKDSYTDPLMFVDSNCDQADWYKIPISACCRTFGRKNNARRSKRRPPVSRL